jgi:hypothetical protein
MIASLHSFLVLRSGVESEQLESPVVSLSNSQSCTELSRSRSTRTWELCIDLIVNCLALKIHMHWKQIHILQVTLTMLSMCRRGNAVGRTHTKHWTVKQETTLWILVFSVLIYLFYCSHLSDRMCCDVRSVCGFCRSETSVYFSHFAVAGCACFLFVVCWNSDFPHHRCQCFQLQMDVSRSFC